MCVHVLYTGGPSDDTEDPMDKADKASLAIQVINLESFLKTEYLEGLISYLILFSLYNNIIMMIMVHVGAIKTWDFRGREQGR